MRDKGTTIQQVILGLALLAALCWNLAQANEINHLDIVTGPSGTRAELHLQSSPTFKTFSLTQPHRLVIDLSGVDRGNALQLPAPAGLIKGVRTGRPAEATTRIVFDLAAPVAVSKPRLETDATGVRLVLEWPTQSATATSTQPTTAPTLPKQSDTAASATATVAAATPTKAPSPASAPATVASTTQDAPPPQIGAQPAPVQAGPIQTAPAQSKPAQASTLSTTSTGAEIARDPSKPLVVAKPQTSTVVEPMPAPPVGPLPMPRNISGRPLIVAIDAGHGGQDPGAMGPSGKREKDVTLAIARELARQVNATPGLKAVLTRDSDMFLPLPRRTQLARQAKADIFISIHADAAENRAAKGSSVYVLSLRGASSQRARWLADKENAADLIGGHALPKADNTLTSVLLDLTQSGQMRASESAAAQVLSGLKDIGNNHKPNIERANFAVLRTSDMPAMLVETAFISNPDEERRLNDPAFQRSLARAVLAGVDGYFQRQPPPGTLYAARAKANEAGKNESGKSAGLSGASPAAPTVIAKMPSATTGGSPE